MVMDEGVATWTRYSVTAEPLFSGSDQETTAVLPVFVVTFGTEGASGAPAPLMTSRGSDQGPAPIL